MWYYCKHCSTYNWLFLFGTCPADCPLDGNATTNRPTVSTAVASGNIVGDLVTLLIYFIFTFGMGWGGSKNVPTTSAISLCLCACGDSGMDERIFTRFMPNISQFNHVIRNKKTKPKNTNL